MQTADVGSLLREALLVALKLGGPPLAASLAVGLVVSLLQAVTQINESTLALVPKVAAIAGVLVLCGSFMMGSLDGFAQHMFDRIVAVGGS